MVKVGPISLTFTPSVTPVSEMQFKSSYLLGLNELVGLAYVQNLGLSMKRAPDVLFKI